MPSPQFDNIVQMFKAQRAAGVATPSIPELRQGIDMLAQMMPPVEGIEVTSQDAGGVPAERISVAGSDEDRIVLYLHGGGYCIGSCNSHRHIAGHLSKAVGTPVLVPDYRLAPEHPFPAAIEDAKAVYGSLLDDGFAADRITITGDSAGGGLTVALQVALRDEGIPLPSASSPHSPYADLATLGEVSDEALDLDYLRPETLDLFCANYAKDADVKSPVVSPVYADLSGLPPMLIQVGGSEILLDTARRLAARAKDCGVDVTLEIEPGLFHAWHLFAGAIPEADESIARVANFFRSHFGS